MQITLIMLVLNEKTSLEVIVPKILKEKKKKNFDELVAIDGGSTDGSIEYLKKKKINTFIQKKNNTGRGAAFLLAENKVNTDAFIFFSPDGNEDIKDIKKFKFYLNKGADLVIASRMMKDSVNEEDKYFFKYRKWANLTFNWLANLFFNDSKRNITDSINGFRAIKKNTMKKLNLSSTDFTIEYQMTIRAMLTGIKIIEFPTFEGDRIADVSKAKTIPTGLRFLKVLLIEVYLLLKNKK